MICTYCQSKSNVLVDSGRCPSCAMEEINKLRAEIERLRDALKDALFVMELYQKRDEPAWDGSASPPSAIGKARAALEQAAAPLNNTTNSS